MIKHQTNGQEVNKQLSKKLTLIIYKLKVKVIGQKP